VTSYEIVSAEIVSPEKGKAVVTYHAQQGAIDFEFTSNEDWVLEDGNWCREVPPSSFPETK